MPDYRQRRKPSARCPTSPADPTFSSAASAAVEPQSPNLEGAEKLKCSGAAPGGAGGQGWVELHARVGRGHSWCLLPARGSFTPPFLRADTEGQPNSGFARCSELGAVHTASPWRRDRALPEPWLWLREAEGEGRGRDELREPLRARKEAGRTRGAVEGAGRGRWDRTGPREACEARLRKLSQSRTG